MLVTLGMNNQQVFNAQLGCGNKRA
jgi:hypothetical protein